MQIFEYIINVPLGYVLSFFYGIFHSYGLALIFFTIVMKLILLPFAIKQQKSQVGMMRVKPKEEAIRKKYANNKEKMNQEIMNLYQAESVNPMSGCLPLLLQMPILFGLYGVINKPLTYIFHLTQEQIVAVDTAMSTSFHTQPGYFQIPMAEAMASNMDKLSFLPQTVHAIDFNFLGINLAHTPSLSHFDILWLIPILAGVSAYFSGVLSQKMASVGTSDQAAAGGMNKMMMLMMPLMSVWITFTTPAGVGFYWTLSNLLIMLQSYVLNRIYDPKKAFEEAKAELSVSNNQKKKQRRMLKMEYEKKLQEEAEEDTYADNTDDDD